MHLVKASSAAGRRGSGGGAAAAAAAGRAGVVFGASGFGSGVARGRAPPGRGRRPRRRRSRPGRHHDDRLGLRRRAQRRVVLLRGARRKREDSGERQGAGHVGLLLHYRAGRRLIIWNRFPLRRQRVYCTPGDRWAEQSPTASSAASASPTRTFSSGKAFRVGDRSSATVVRPTPSRSKQHQGDAARDAITTVLKKPPPAPAPPPAKGP